MPWWVKVDADIDDHPKACAAGFDACALFQFFLRVNGRREFGGVIPRSYWSTPYVQRKTGLDPSVVEARIQACVDADLLAIDGSNLVIVGWGGGEWDVAPKTDAERQQNRRDRLKNRHGESRERDSASRQSDAVTRVTLTDRPTDRSKTDRERESGARSRDDSPLTDATRTDLDADSKHLATHTATDADTIERAREKHAPLFRRLRLAVQPSDRIRNDLVWNQMLPSATRSFAEAESCCASPAEFAAALTWAMQDAGDEKFPGWRRVLSTPSKVAEKFADGAVLEQYRASGEVAKRERETGHSRRSAGPEPPDYAAITREREAYEKRVREEFEASERAAGRPPARQPQRRGGDPTPLGAVLKEVLR